MAQVIAIPSVLRVLPSKHIEYQPRMGKFRLVTFDSNAGSYRADIEAEIRAVEDGLIRGNTVLSSKVFIE